jgi:hypothetical protein
MDRLFLAVAIPTAAAGMTLSIGILYGSVPLMAAGAAMSAVFPWGIAAAWLIRRRRVSAARRGRTGT